MDHLRSHTSLLASDGKGTPLAVHGREAQRIAWSAHGFQGRSTGVMRTGFNGELRERRGVYLLGSYRAYNPVLMCLHSPDSLSPFGPGGVNAYAYCLGDPVNRVDPTGHLPWWGMTALGLAAPALGVAGVALISQAAAGAIAISTKVATALGSATIVIEGFAAFMPEGKARNATAWAGLAMGTMAAAGAAVAFKRLAPARYATAKDRFKGLFHSRRRPRIDPVPDVGQPGPRVVAEIELPITESSNNRLNRRIHEATFHRNRTRAELNRAISGGADPDQLHGLRAALEFNEVDLLQAEESLYFAQRPRLGRPVPANPPDLIAATLEVRSPRGIWT